MVSGVTRARCGLIARSGLPCYCACPAALLLLCSCFRVGQHCPAQTLAARYIGGRDTRPVTVLPHTLPKWGGVHANAGVQGVSVQGREWVWLFIGHVGGGVTRLRSRRVGLSPVLLLTSCAGGLCAVRACTTRALSACCAALVLRVVWLLLLPRPWGFTRTRSHSSAASRGRIIDRQQTPFCCAAVQSACSLGDCTRGCPGREAVCAALGGGPQQPHCCLLFLCFARMPCTAHALRHRICFESSGVHVQAAI